MALLDPHSFADDTQPVVRHVEWRAAVDFTERALHCVARLHLERPLEEGATLDLDTRALELAEIRDQRGWAVPFELGPVDPVFGQRLRLSLPPHTAAISVRYRTSPDASALQWLGAAQTLGGRHPYLFSQCQAIHARSVLPCQDTPARRITYGAELLVPPGLTAVMAAAGIDAKEEAGGTRFRFRMVQPIPPYLLAFAVGELGYRDLSPRSRVWTEPGLLDAAAWEFADVERHLAAAEGLFGPYDWERFDLLVMPPSFPYGGMENPRLTFLTPTLLAKDRSLVNVVAHELAHSWTGNLVTNVNAEHFWLNEGFTVFAERRIIEALDGTEAAELQAALGRRELDDAVARFRAQGLPQLTCLRTHLAGVDPDEAFSVVPYEKGYLFLRLLEATLGRTQFDALLQGWLAGHRFGAVTTEDFTRHVEAVAPGALEAIDATAWIDGEGIPPNAPPARSTRLDAVLKLAGSVPEVEVTQGWNVTEWQLFLDATPRPAAPDELASLDRRFSLSTSANAELLSSWLCLALESNYAPAIDPACDFLGRIGRMKYLKPLYRALAQRPETREVAERCFDQNAPRYHPIARQVLRSLLDKAAATVQSTP